jgi:uncharacterized DUF497 family protein
VARGAPDEQNRCTAKVALPTFGMSAKERILLTVFIERSEDETCIISARLATRPERRRYEESE